MKRSLVIKGLITILVVFIFGLSAVGCKNSDKNNNDGSINDDGNTNNENVNDVIPDKTALNAELASEITAQGDYTADSYNAYAEKLAKAKAVASDAAATQKSIDKATEELKSARLALAVRPVVTVMDADKDINLTSGDVKEIALADYVNVNGLSKITYKVLTSNEIVTLSAISDGKFTITAGKVSKETVVKVAINVYYDNVAKRTVELSVKIAKEAEATLVNEEIVREYDLVLLENKDSIVLDFAENVNNDSNLELTYSAKRGNEDLVLDGSSYTFVFGTYTEETTYETFTVTVSYTAKGEEHTLEYTYVLALRDTGRYSVINGGFESGIEGWTVVGNIGKVSSDTNYWLNDSENADGYAFGMDGEKMFSAYAEGAEESAVGTLTSSTFILGGSGYVTFKLGAMKDENYVYLDVVDAETKEILARYYNGLWAERTDNAKSGCTLIAYKADLSAFLGKELFFRISDNADSGYGLFFADSFITYYENEPEGFNDATPVSYEVSGTVYDLFNGGFEMGDVQGWWNSGVPGAVTGADMFFDGREYGKDGNYLYSGVEDAAKDDEGNVIKAGNGKEGNTGVLTSSAFELGGAGYVTYMLGGGNAFCYVQVIDSTTGEVLARYRQQAREDAILKKYVADLSAHVGKTVRIQLVDNATADWGCVSFDNVVTYYDEKPEGYIDAVDVKYEIVNGSFESGMDGWKQNITEAGAQNTLGWVQSEEIAAEWYTQNGDRKDGINLFTFAKPDGTNCENTKGTLDSTVFTLKKDAFVSFRFGGAGTRDVYVQLCKANGEVIATFYNEAPGKANTEMYAYFYQYTGDTADCFFRVVDNSVSNYGCFVVDDFRVNLDAAPEGFTPAIQ